MADHSALMTVVHAQIAQLRLTGLTLGALIAKGQLTPAEAAKLVGDAEAHLTGGHLNETVLAQFRDAYRRLREDLLEHPGPGPW